MGDVEASERAERRAVVAALRAVRMEVAAGMQAAAAVAAVLPPVAVEGQGWPVAVAG